jgi:thiamine transport system substrate-binding protein
MIGLAVALWQLSEHQEHSSGGKPSVVQVLSYGSFVNSWGPGPEIAKRFLGATGITVEYRDAGDAGLLLNKLDLFPSDVVVGFDRMALGLARAKTGWRPLEIKPPVDSLYAEPDFLPFDWGALTFIYRKGEIEPPRSLDDLLDARFRGTIALEDPRTSAPGMQFLLWVLGVKGVDGGFQYLTQLKPNLQSVSGSWSQAYGLFTKHQAKLAFSYSTSPVYHEVEEKDSSYAASVFGDGHPTQVEYVGVPSACTNCDAGEKFAQFLLRPDVQVLIMKKNYMLPILKGGEEGTPFAQVPNLKVFANPAMADLLKKRDELLERWRQLEL